MGIKIYSMSILKSVTVGSLTVHENVKELCIFCSWMSIGGMPSVFAWIEPEKVCFPTEKMGVNFVGMLFGPLLVY